MSRLTDEIYERGLLSRKAIAEEQDNANAFLEKKRKGGEIFTIDECARYVNLYGCMPRKDARMRFLVRLDWIGTVGGFDASKIAETLFLTNSTHAAMSKLAEMKANIEERNREEKIIRKGISQVIPANWRHEVEVITSGVRVRFYAPKSKYGEFIEGSENCYYFLQTLLYVRPMLSAARIKFDEESFGAIAGVWRMGESSYCYNYSIDTKGEEVLAKEKKSYRDYYADYALPEHIKAAILDGVRNSICDIRRDVYTDHEGCSYNSLVRRRIPDKGLWTGASRAA